MAKERTPRGVGIANAWDGQAIGALGAPPGRGNPAGSAGNFGRAWRVTSDIGAKMRGFLLGYSRMPSDLSPPIPAAPGDDGPDGRSATAPDELDPELLALPDPPRRERTWTLLLLALTAVVCVAMAVALRQDASYAFAPSVPTEMGDLRDLPPPAGGEASRFVSAHGMLGAAGAMRFERPFVEDSFRLSPVAGRHDVWVLVRVPAGEENARYVPPAQFRGRLVSLDAAGLRNRGLRAALAQATGEPVPARAWLVLDGETPAGASWAVGLVALFLAFALWNVGAIARLVRPVRS